MKERERLMLSFVLRGAWVCHPRCHVWQCCNLPQTANSCGRDYKLKKWNFSWILEL